MFHRSIPCPADGRGSHLRQLGNDQQCVQGIQQRSNGHVQYAGVGKVQRREDTAAACGENLQPVGTSPLQGTVGQ